jgi:hypothetical protein
MAKYGLTVPVCTIEGTDNRAFGIRGYIPQLLKFQVVNELYCITEAPLDVL